VNGALKGAFVNIGQKFFRVFGLIKIKLLLAFTLSAYNRETIRSFRARKAVEAENAKKPRSAQEASQGHLARRGRDPCRDGAGSTTGLIFTAATTHPLIQGVIRTT